MSRHLPSKVLVNGRTTNRLPTSRSRLQVVRLTEISASGVGTRDNGRAEVNHRNVNLRATFVNGPDQVTPPLLNSNGALRLIERIFNGNADRQSGDCVQEVVLIIMVPCYFSGARAFVILMTNVVVRLRYLAKGGRSASYRPRSRKGGLSRIKTFSSCRYLGDMV